MEMEPRDEILGRWVYLSSPAALKDTAVPSHSLFLLRLILGYPGNGFLAEEISRASEIDSG